MAPARPQTPAGPRPARRDRAGWLSRERVLGLVLLGATVVAFYLCFLVVRPLLPALAWGLALAAVTHPLHRRLARRLRHPNLAAGLAVAVVAVVIVGPALFVAQQLLEQSITGLALLQREAESGRWRAITDRSPMLTVLVAWLGRLGNVGALGQWISGLAAEQVPSLLRGSAWLLLQLLVMLFALFYFFRDWRPALGRVRSLVPLAPGEADEVLARTRDTLVASIYGKLAVSALQGTLGGLAFWALGLPAPVLWGLIMGLLSIVPVLGAFVVWIPAVALLALEGSWGKAALLLAWGTVVIGLSDNVVYPILVGTRLQLHSLTAFVAIVGGLLAFGASGVVLGPLILALTDALLEIWRRRTAGGHTAEEAVEPGAA